MQTEPRIYAVGYRRLNRDGNRRPPQWAIARTMVALAWRRRATKFALLMCLMVFLGASMWLAVQLVIKRYAPEVLGPEAAFFDVDMLVGQTRELLSYFLTTQFYTTAIAIAVVAGGAIAEDRSAGALELYFARPLTRFQYGSGKLLGAFAVPFATIVIPVTVLWIMAVGVAEPSLRDRLLWMIGPALLGAMLAAAVLSATIIGLSAVGKRARTVTAAYVTALYVGSPIAEALAQDGIPWAGYFAPQRSLRLIVDSLLEVDHTSVGAQLLRSGPEQGLVFGTSVLALAAFIGVGLFLLAYRLKQASV